MNYDEHCQNLNAAHDRALRQAYIYGPHGGDMVSAGMALADDWEFRGIVADYLSRDEDWNFLAIRAGLLPAFAEAVAHVAFVSHEIEAWMATHDWPDSVEEDYQAWSKEAD